MIKNIIFDIGNVLINFDWGEYIRELFDEETYKIVRSAMFSELWNEIDRGILTDDELLSGFTRLAGGYEREIRIAYNEVGRAVTKLDYSIPWIKELKKAGYKVYYLSNYSHHVMRSNPDALSFTKYMDGGIFSCNVHYTKPEAKIYELLFEKYSLIPNECVFIDDNAANIKAAQELGMETIQFKSYSSARQELNKKTTQSVAVPKQRFLVK